MTQLIDHQTDPLLRPDEVAARWGVRTETVWRWIRQRKLPARRIGGRYVIRTSMLAEFEARHEKLALDPMRS